MKHKASTAYKRLQKQKEFLQPLWADAAPPPKFVGFFPFGGDWVGSTSQLSRMTSRSSTWRIGPPGLGSAVRLTKCWVRQPSKHPSRAPQEVGSWVIDSTPDSDDPGLVRNHYRGSNIYIYIYIYIWYPPPGCLGYIYIYIYVQTIIRGIIYVY